MAHTLCSQSGLVGASIAHHSQLAVALRDDGVIIYDTRTQRPTKTWALGLPDQRLCGSPAYDARSQQFFAAAQPARDGASSGSILLTWSRKADAVSLKQAAQQAQLPAPVHSLHPQPAAAARRQDAADAAAAMDVDGCAAGADAETPAVFAVYANGAVASCSPAGVLSENIEARGLQPIAASASEDGLTVVHVDQRTGGASCSSYHLQGGKVQCGPITPLSPPEADSRALAAACTSGRIAVLWSDGTLAVYPSSSGGDGSSSPSSGAGGGSSSQLRPQLCRRLRGFALPQQDHHQQQQRTAAPQNGKLGRSSKKRAHGSDSGASAAATVSLAALGDSGLLAVAGWSTETAGSTAVRLVVLDCIYGCVQAALDLTAADVGAPQLDPSQPVQAVALGEDGQLAVVAGGSVLLAELQLRPPTLDNLIGALCLGAAPSAGAAVATAEPGASGNPCAAAAAAALHESELALLMGPSAAGGSAPAPVQYSLEVQQQGASAQQLLLPVNVRWSEPSAAPMQQAERSAWAALLGPASAAAGGGGGGGKKGAGGGAGGSGLLQAARQLVQASRQHGVAVSQRLLSRLLQAAAERRQWECVGELVAAQHPGSLAGCPGLVPALAVARQYPLLQLLLSQASDVPADDLASALKSLLCKVPSDEAKQAQRAYWEGASAAAEAAVAAAERAAGTAASGPLLAVAACSAGAVEGFTPAQVCLHPLVAVKHDSGALLGALHQLSAAEALALLRYLRTLLRSHAQLVGDHYLAAAGAGLPGAIVLPHPAAAVEWAGAAMDTNMARLVLQREAAQVLSDMRGLVDRQLRALRRLSQVRGVLQQAQLGAGSLPAPHAAAAAKYTLEWLDLRVG